MSVERVFISPSGRSWTVRVLEPPPRTDESRVDAGGVVQPVLRFVSEGIVLDLADWPANWLDLTDPELVGLARRASPPCLGMRRSGTGTPGPDRDGRR